MKARLALAAATFAFLAACQGGEDATQAEVGKAVEVAEVKADATPEPIMASGTLKLKREVPLSFKISGIIDRFQVEDGDLVKTGDVLAQLIDTEIDARERDALETLAQAERDLARAEALAKDGFASAQRLDNAKTAVARAKAALDGISFDRRFSRIVAPADGIVLRRIGEPNQTVATGTTVIVLGDLASGFIMTAALADRDIVRTKIDDPAEIGLAVTAGAAIPGRVQRLSAKADDATGHFDVEVRIDADPNTLPLLRSGMIGTLTIKPSLALRSDLRLTIPAEAILEGDGTDAKVIVVDETSTARVRIVSVGGFTNERILIARGLQEGERVITAGAAYVNDGEAVVVSERLAEAVNPGTE